MLTQFLTCFVFAMVLASASSSSCAERTNIMSKVTVHGRLTFYNGTPSWRIWIVGTKRLLGVRQSPDEAPDVPKGVRDLLSPGRDMFADFTVEPLTPEQPGVMRLVRVVSIRKVVVTEGSQIVLRKSEL